MVHFTPVDPCFPDSLMMYHILFCTKCLRDLLFLNLHIDIKMVIFRHEFRSLNVCYFIQVRLEATVLDCPVHNLIIICYEPHVQEQHFNVHAIITLLTSKECVYVMREILQQATHVSGLTSSSTLVVRVELDLQIESVKKKFSRITHFLNAFLDLEAE